MSGCEAAKARKGEDPHKSTDQAQKDLEKHIEKSAAAKFGPAVTFGGSVQASANANATQADSPTTQMSAGNGAPAVTSSVDVLA
jgi:hypothetical protein